MSAPGAAMIRPIECSTVKQNPPDFSWPAIGSGPYTVTLTFPDGHSETRSAAQNWLNWNGSLPAGSYAWTIAGAGQLSLPRQFNIAADALAFVVPGMDDVIAKLLAKPRPRALPDATSLAAMASQRNTALSALLWQVNQNLGETLPPDGAQGDGYRYNGYGMRALWSLMAYVYDSSNLSAREDARRRVLNLASWNPRGASANDDLESVYIAWVVVLGYDWLGPVLTQAERDLVLPNLAARVGDLRNYVVGAAGWPPTNLGSWVPPPLWQSPRDAHRNALVTTLAVMSALLVGDLPAADGWTRELLPFALNVVNPWSGEDGGYADGTAYSMWDVSTSLSAWYALRWATCDTQQTCIDLGRKAWVRNYSRFLAYFSPPTFAADLAVHNTRSSDAGTPVGLFGDGFAEAQLFELRARLAKALANFAPSPLGCWYASSLVGEDYTRIEYLMSPPTTCTLTSSMPPGTANTLYLRSTGWIAMHSDLADPSRTSVYFKSSPQPFGAYNHQSADQNAFVINAGGERLAIESGYYDAYNSGHWQYWVKRTLSKNAVTFDGGVGEIAFEHQPDPYQPGNMRYGSIRQQLSTADYDIVSADATDTYHGALTRAVRTLVYLRPGTIVLYENLASDSPRKWEWNIHALDQIAVISENSQVRITRGAQTLCIDALAGPGGAFAQTIAWPSGAAPAVGSSQWHGRFISAQPSTSVEFIALLRVGCAPTAASASKTNGVWTVPVGGKNITIDASGAAAVTP